MEEHAQLLSGGRGIPLLTCSAPFRYATYQSLTGRINNKSCAQHNDVEFLQMSTDCECHAGDSQQLVPDQLPS